MIKVVHPVGQAEVERILLEVVRECYAQGPGFSMDVVVLREAANRLGIQNDEAMQQVLLDCWHDLFLSKRLGWGFNLDNPGAPWFHIRGDLAAKDAAK